MLSTMGVDCEAMTHRTKLVRFLSGSNQGRKAKARAVAIEVTNEEVVLRRRSAN